MINRIELHNGDCMDHLGAIGDCTIDSVVTDPPYGLRFMAQQWDYEVPSVDLWRECLRVLKPGGHLLAFGGSRTYHRLAVAVEDAGFEIRDQIMWVYGSGFPKSHNLKGDYEGWGTALKPAHEPIVMARKPFKGTVANNVMEHGTGALNIDGCRIEHVTVGDGSLALNPHLRGHIKGGNGGHIIASETKRRLVTPHQSGRWPANLIHDGSDEVVELFPANAGASAPVKGTESSKASVGNVTGERDRVPGAFHADKGSAARFFYCAKASRKDRHEGLSDPGHQFKHGETLRHIENAATNGNNHPTVKPTDLMAYLCRLVTPIGGVVLDPFMGSGSTGKAALREGFRFIGMEVDEGYFSVAEMRIKHELKPTYPHVGEQAQLEIWRQQEGQGREA